MKPPIIVNECQQMDAAGDVTLYASVANAELNLEPIDVENDEYFAFDAEGRLLALRTDGQKVTISAAEPEPTHQEILRSLLSDLFVRAGLIDDRSSPIELAELVRMGLENYAWAGGRYRK
jgi:hypothetical protein